MVLTKVSNRRGFGDETVNRAGDVGNEGKQFADLEPLMAEEVVVLSRIRICSF